MRPMNTSAVQYIPALSPTQITVGGSTNPLDLSKFTKATLIVSTGSTAAGTIAVNVQRSATSNGTFQPIGASVSAAVLGSTHVRSFVCESSAVWYRLHYTQTGNGSPVMSMIVAAQGARAVPVDQYSGVTSYSTIA